MYNEGKRRQETGTAVQQGQPNVTALCRPKSAWRPVSHTNNVSRYEAFHARNSSAYTLAGKSVMTRQACTPKSNGPSRSTLHMHLRCCSSLIPGQSKHTRRPSAHKKQTAQRHVPLVKPCRISRNRPEVEQARATCQCASWQALSVASQAAEASGCFVSVNSTVSSICAGVRRDGGRRLHRCRLWHFWLPHLRHQWCVVI